MIDFNGVKCPVCGVPFHEDDDVVVCPQCGAPYHRHCYEKEGKCIFTGLHESGKEWSPPSPPKAPDVSAEIKDRECPACGCLNSHSALFCSRCGGSLLGQPQRYQNSPPPPVPPHRSLWRRAPTGALYSRSLYFRPHGRGEPGGHAGHGGELWRRL